MKKNQKGFSLMELVAAVAILGVLTGVAVIGYSRYASSARDSALEMLRKSSENAMAEYLMDHPYKTNAKLSELYSDGYLEEPKSPYSSSELCTGKVEVVGEGDEELADPEYKVILCCTGHYVTYTYEQDETNPEGKKVVQTKNETCQAE